MKRFITQLMLALIFLLVLSISLLSVAAQGDSQNDSGPTVFATNTPQAPSQALAAAPQPDAAARHTVVLDDVQTVTDLFEPEVCAYIAGQPTSVECLQLMEQFSEPTVANIAVDTATINQYSFWRVGPQAVNLYDAPGGNVVGQIPEGFNFVNAQSVRDGWIQDENGQWISTNDAFFVEPSTFTGVLLPEGWNTPFLWILDTTGIWASTFPGGPSTEASGLIPLRYERYIIFAEAVDADGWTWYMVGPNQWIKQIYVSVVKPAQRPEGVDDRWVAVDLFEQTLIAYEDDTPVFATLVSSGLPGSETNEGIFEVWARLQRDGMSGATGAPDAYALQSVPWVQYFDNDIALHGAYWHDLFGYRRSHGCVNMSISDSSWLFDWMLGGNVVNENGDIRSLVYVFSSDEYRPL